MLVAERLFAAPGPDKRTKVRLLTGMQDRVEKSIHAFHARLLAQAQASLDATVAQMVRKIEEDRASVKEVCVAGLMGRDPEEELRHDLVNNETTLSLYEELWNLLPSPRDLKALHARQRAIDKCLQKLGIRTGRNDRF